MHAGMRMCVRMVETHGNTQTPSHHPIPVETQQLMWDNQLPPSMKPFKMGSVTFKTSVRRLSSSSFLA